jgi:branched-chain amino acid transport system substrate-binding protein
MRSSLLRMMALSAALSLAVLSLTGCGSKGASGGSSTDTTKPITLALAAPMSGDGAEYGKAFEQGARLAINQFNAKGGYQGRKVDLVVGDDKNDPAEAAKVASKLASNKEVSAVIGHWASSTTLAGSPIYNHEQVPVITPTASHPDITKPNTTWTFRSSTTQDMEGKNLADLAVNKLGKKKIAVMYINTDWGKANATFFKQYAEQFGAQVVYFEAYPPGQGIDFTASLSKVKGLNPDMLYLGSLYAEGIRIVKQAKELGITAAIEGGSPFNSETLLKEGGKEVEGLYLDTLYLPTAPSPKVQQFVKEFKATYNVEPGYFNALAYDATSVVLKAIEVGGPTRQGIRDAMASKVNGLEVVTGTIQFDANRSDVNKPYYNLVVKNGQFTVVQ